MYTEEIRISVIPGAMCNIINISQYDVGVRSFHFVPYTTEGDLTYQAGCAVTLEATKPDRSAIIHNCTYNSDGSIDYTLQEQLAAVAGRVWSKLVLRDTLGGILGTAAIVWVVDRAGVTDGAEMSDSDISAVQEFIQEFGSINAYGAALHGLMAAYGGPLTANAASGMTDQTKVYVYTGTTTSALTNGHWYYYDGSSWADGGVYQAAAVQTDTTLTVAGEAADAKAAGDKITELKNDFTDALDGFYSSTEQEITNLTRYTGKRYGGDGALIDNTPSVGTSEAVEINVTPGEVIKWVCYYANRNSTYNIKYVLTSDVIEADTNYTTNENEYTFTVPSDCVKVLASCWALSTTGNHFYKITNEYQSVKNYIDGEITTVESTVSADIEAVKTDSANAYLPKIKGIVPDFLTLFDKDNIIEGYWYNYNDGGKVQANTARFIYPLIPCKANTTYTKRTCNICIFDSNKELISTVLWNDPAVFTTPSNAAYFGISMTTTSLDSVRLVEGERPSGEIKQPRTAISLDQIKTYIVDIAGAGDYSSLTEAVFANSGKKVKIEVRPGTYDLLEEYKNLFGTDFFDNESFSDEGLVINYGSEIILDTAAIVKFDYTGNNSRVSQFFSPFKFGGSGGMLKGGQIKCSNCRYAIHDDTYASPHDKRVIDGVYIYYRSDRNVAIGGGLGYSSDVELKNCYVDSGETGYGVFYHNASYANAENTVKIHDNYFTAGIYIQPFGPSTAISKALVSNNKAPAVGRITTSMTVDNFELVAWNNDTNA